MLNNPVGGLITKGLGLPACKGMITNQFHLSCGFEFKVVVSGQGGPYPYPAWNRIENIHNFYTPTEEQPLHVPLSDEANYFRKHKTITISVQYNEHTIEKIYRVSESKAKWIVSVVNLLNATKDRITVHANNIKRVTSKIVLTVKNVRSWTKK